MILPDWLWLAAAVVSTLSAGAFLGWTLRQKLPPKDLDKLQEVQGRFARLEALLESSPEVLLLLSADGAILSSGRAAERLLGKAEHAIHGRTILDLVHPEDRARVKRLLAEIVANADRQLVTQLRLLQSDGSWCWLEGSVSNRLAHPQLKAVVLHLHDVTEARRASRRLRDSERLLDAIRQVQLVYIVNPDPRATYDHLLQVLLKLTKSAYGFIGELLYDLEGRPYLKSHAITNLAWDVETQRLYEQTAATGMEFHNMKTLFGAVLTTGQPVLSNAPASDPRAGGLPPGHPPIHAFLGLPIRHSGEVIGMVGMANRPGGYEPATISYLQPLLTTCAYILEGMRQRQRRQRAEAERQQALEDLRQSEERYRTLVETAPDIIAIIDLQARIVTINSAVRTLLGWEPSEVVGHPFTDFLHPEDVAEAQIIFHKALAGEKLLPVEHRVRARSGATVIVECVGAPLRREGKVEGYIVLARDLTEARQLKEQIQQAANLEAIGRLAGGVAHDFNNLLTVILGYSELAREEIPENHSARLLLDEISRAGQRASSLTRQLLAFGRKHPWTPQVIHLDAVIDNLESMMRPLLGEDVELHRVRAPDVWPVFIDPTQLEQVLLNLTLNARDAMPTGGLLEVATANCVLSGSEAERLGLSPGDYVRLSVRDTGCGMDEHTRKHAFEPFFTTKQTGKGTGLGLATVYGIIKQVGGHIEVQSILGQGATFVIHLPRHTASDPLPQPSPESTKILRGTESILVVEDEASVREFTCSVLRQHGYQVVEAADGPSGLKQCRECVDNIDLVLTDAVMPGLSGRELAEAVEQFRPRMPFLFMSGHTDDTLLHRGIQTNSAAFLQKPFSADELLAKVREVLGQAKSNLV